MKRILWGVLIFLAFVFSSYTLFETTVHEQGCYYEGITVIPSEAGGWLVSGAYNCTGVSSGWKSCLVQLDVNGDTVSLLKNLPFNGIMKSLPDGNLIFAGGNRAGFAYDTAAIFMVSITGELLWKKNLFEGLCHHLLTDILPLGNDLLVLGNFAQASCSSPVYDSYIAKFNAAGELVWKHDVTGAGNDQLHVVKITKDNQIAAFGWTENKSSSDDADYLLIKLDENGNKIWSHTFGDEADNYGYGMDVLPDGGFVVNGHSSTMEVMRLSADGNLVWTKSIMETCGGRYFKTSALQDGGLLFWGMEKSGTQPCQTALIKTNSSGEIFWKKTMTGVVRSVDASHTGRYVVTGYKSYLPKLFVSAFDTTTTLEEKSNSGIRHFSAQENFFSSEAQLPETTTELSPIESQRHHRVFPNPAIDFTCIEFTNADHKLFHLQIFNVQGKRVMNQFSTTEIFVVDKLSEKGIYSYLLTGDAEIFSGKILIQ